MKYNALQTDKFLWGVATSAFQIEGQIQNDMTEWESLGKFKNNGYDPNYENASLHWQNWEKDFDLLKTLQVNSYRFSLEWARIQPDMNQFNQRAINQYQKMVDRLLELNITPMLTLHHFSHPSWFHHRTPWHQESSIEIFYEYTRKIIDIFHDRINLYITFNEPLVWLLGAYAEAKFPPGEKNLDLLITALTNMLQCHQKVYDLIKSKNKNAEVGIAKNLIVFSAQRGWNLFDRGIVLLIHNFFNRALLEAFRNNKLKLSFPFLLNFETDLQLSDKLDFWGINYYYRMHLKYKFNRQRPIDMNFANRSGEGLSDMGWEIYSEGLWKVIQLVQQTGKPFYITENGIADANDILRLAYLKNHLRIIQRAREKELPLKGYYYWSLLDNYEWLVGKQAKFGLFEVDFNESYQRRLRDSGSFYADYILNQTDQ